MKLARWQNRGVEQPGWGLVLGEEVRDLQEQWPGGLLAMLGSGQGGVGGAVGVPFPSGGPPAGSRRRNSASTAPKPRLPLAEVDLLAPIEPPSFRDFYAFEAHVRNARKRRGLEMVPEWYEIPVFYFSNTASIVGPDAPVRKPPETRELDYELEIAVVIGREGSDIPVSEADDYIGAFTILNDWSARDIQRQEMKVGLGPAKGKDFATSVGPFLVTPDELEHRVLPDRDRGKRYDLTMTAAVNGREYSRGNARDMHWTFAELIAHASRNARLRPGDLLGSGTVGTGCITEFPEGTFPWLQHGDVVALEIEGLGRLINTVIRDP